MEKKKNELIQIEVEGTQYPVSCVPAKVNFEGQEKLDDDIKKVVDLYKGFDPDKVTNDQLNQIKLERTHINKLAKALTSGTNDIVAYAGKELLDFEMKNKSKVKDLNAISSNLKIAIDRGANKLKRDKHEQNLKYIEGELTKNSLSVDDYLQLIDTDYYNEKWDNKTFSFKTFQEEVQKVIDQIKEKEKQHAQEVSAVIEACKSAKSSIDDNYFIERLKVISLPEVLKEIRIHDEEVQRAVNHDWNKTDIPTEEPIQNDIPTAPINNQTMLNGKVVDKETGEVVDHIVRIVLDMKLTQEQLKLFIPVLRKFTTDNHIDHSAFSLRKVEK